MCASVNNKDGVNVAGGVTNLRSAACAEIRCSCRPLLLSETEMSRAAASQSTIAQRRWKKKKNTSNIPPTGQLNFRGKGSNKIMGAGEFKEKKMVAFTREKPLLQVSPHLPQHDGVFAVFQLIHEVGQNQSDNS